VYHSKRSPTTITAQKLNEKQVHLNVIDSPNLTRDTRVKVTLVARPLFKSCDGAKMVYSRAERVFILEHYFASRSFASVCVAFSNAYLDKEVPNKTTIH
jgi:hypothetical protein